MNLFLQWRRGGKDVVREPLDDHDQRCSGSGVVEDVSNRPADDGPHHSRTSTLKGQ